MGRGMLHQRLLADGSHNTCMPPLYADVSALCLTSPFSMAKVPNPKLGFGSRDDDEGGVATHGPAESSRTHPTRLAVAGRL